MNNHESQTTQVRAKPPLDQTFSTLDRPLAQEPGRSTLTAHVSFVPTPVGPALPAAKPVEHPVVVHVAEGHIIHQIGARTASSNVSCHDIVTFETRGRGSRSGCTDYRGGGGSRGAGRHGSSGGRWLLGRWDDALLASLIVTEALGRAAAVATGATISPQGDAAVRWLTIGKPDSGARIPCRVEVGVVAVLVIIGKAPGRRASRGGCGAQGARRCGCGRIGTFDVLTLVVWIIPSIAIYIHHAG